MMCLATATPQLLVAKSVLYLCHLNKNIMQIFIANISLKTRLFEVQIERLHNSYIRD